LRCAGDGQRRRRQGHSFPVAIATILVVMVTRLRLLPNAGGGREAVQQALSLRDH